MIDKIKKISPKTLIIAALIGCIITGFIGLKIFLNRPDKSTVIMTFNYENSSAGLNPDNSKFNLRSFKGNEVLIEALELTGMTGNLTPNELSSFISIKGVSSKPIDVNSDTKYIDSTYEVTLTLPKEYSKLVSSRKLLEEICESYREWFVSNYVIDSKALEIDTTNFENMEYSTISSYFDMIAARGRNYLEQKENSSTAFIGENNTTWKSLKQELSNLTSYDIATFNQYIWENGIAKDKAWEITVFEHKNNDLNIDYELYLSNVNKYDEVVGEYRNEMTASALIPTYDKLAQFYMSRTKTGIDELSKAMNRHLESAVDVKEKIDLNADKISKLEQSTITDTEKADIMLENIQLKLVDIFARIKKLDEEYVSEKTDGYIKYEFVEEKSILFS